MIPNNLPYRKLPRDEIDIENLTWFNYIIGRFSGEMWYDRDDIDASGIEPMHYQPVPFSEELNNLHLWFLGNVAVTRNQTNMPNVGWLESDYEDVEEPHFHLDTQCRFDIWTLYNHPPEQVNLEIGGTVQIEILPEQEEIKNIPLLHDTIPSDVPLIFGPRMYSPPGGSSIPARPFGKINSQVSTTADMQEQYWQQLPGNH